MKFYGPCYLHFSATNDIKLLFDHYANDHGFPGMLGILDCMHWKQANCLVVYHGQYTCGDHGFPSVIHEVVASKYICIWHAFFSSVGSLNDINVLNNSPIFNQMYDDTASYSSFDLRGRHYRFSYYLVIGIYHERSVFVKTLLSPDDTRRIRFKRAKKNEERYGKSIWSS